MRESRSTPSALDQVRSVCLSLREGDEVEAWGEPTFRVRNKQFAMYYTLIAPKTLMARLDPG